MSRLTLPDFLVVLVTYTAIFIFMWVFLEKYGEPE